MNVRENWITVTQMLSVPTPLVASPAPVMMGTQVVGRPAQVRNEATSTLLNYNRSLLVYQTFSIALPSAAVVCLALPDPANGAVDYDSTTFGSMATYSCSSGYQQEGGDRERTCLPSGQWSGEEAQCGGMA